MSSYIKYFILLLLVSFAYTDNSSTRLTNQVIEDSVNAVNATFNYNAVNYVEKFNKVKKHFTVDGWKRYVSALKKSGNINFVKINQLVAYSERMGDPKVISQTANKIIVTVPFKLSYINSIFILEQNILTTITILTEPNRQAHKIDDVYSQIISTTTENLVSPVIPNMCR